MKDILIYSGTPLCGIVPGVAYPVEITTEGSILIVILPNGEGIAYKSLCELNKAWRPLEGSYGIIKIAAERERQINGEGYTEDAKYIKGELARAGAFYALPLFYRKDVRGLWPWDWEHYKPTPETRVKELAKAGALIAAEIDRIKNS